MGEVTTVSSVAFCALEEKRLVFDELVIRNYGLSCERGFWEAGFSAGLGRS